VHNCMGERAVAALDCMQRLLNCHTLPNGRLVAPATTNIANASPASHLRLSIAHTPRASYAIHVRVVHTKELILFVFVSKVPITQHENEQVATVMS